MSNLCLLGNLYGESDILCGKVTRHNYRENARLPLSTLQPGLYTGPVLESNVRIFCTVNPHSWSPPSRFSVPHNSTVMQTSRVLSGPPIVIDGAAPIVSLVLLTVVGARHMGSGRKCTVDPGKQKHLVGVARMRIR